ncbi:predicted protein [Lichtheimia corymbifera JMRC:FSU:9682]|uniref:Uncharacterized protein n=1 Tax=Lichtheimia corymbifera JMRC:FSU:9682 TaxID=1263082 RepID=A0A068RI75_9FUNG|nr:predicted protein [Lichtheimia corymbifera JMRC:FSU:9682]
MRIIEIKIIEGCGERRARAYSNAKRKESAIGRAILSLLERHHYDQVLGKHQAYLGSSIRPHWGDTAPRTFKKHPHSNNRAKMHLLLAIKTLLLQQISTVSYLNDCLVSTLL